MALIETLDTGFGAWNPLLWLVALVVALLIAWLIRSRGESARPSGAESAKPYLSGNDAPSAEETHVGASNLYWGFTDALKGYYDRVVPIHSGILTDYVLWFIGVLALVIIMAGVL